jgi:type IV pilus assembly protein PilM
MIRLTRSQVHPIGLDIGHDSVKMIQLERAGGKLSVLGAARAALPAEARAEPERRLALAAGVIRQLLRQRSFRGRRVVAALPREFVHVRNLRLPVMPDTDLIEAIRAEARGMFPFDPAEAQLQFLPAGEVRHGNEVRQEVILVAARHRDVDGFVAALGDAGVVLEALDVEPCAMYRAVDRYIRRRDDENEVHVLVDVGAQLSQVVIGRGREISFVKSIEIGGRHLQEAVSRKLGISMDEAQALRKRLTDPTDTVLLDVPPEEKDAVRQAAHDATRGAIEALGREISRCLRYYAVTFRGPRPTRLRLIGGEAADPQLLSILNKLLAIPAEVAQPLLSLDTSRMIAADRKGSCAEWGVALGLSLKCVQGSYGPRDGKPREAAAPPAAPAVATPEVAHA